MPPPRVAFVMPVDIAVVGGSLCLPLARSLTPDPALAAPLEGTYQRGELPVARVGSRAGMPAGSRCLSGTIARMIVIQARSQHGAAAASRLCRRAPPHCGHHALAYTRPAAPCTAASHRRAAASLLMRRYLVCMPQCSIASHHPPLSCSSLLVCMPSWSIASRHIPSSERQVRPAGKAAEDDEALRQAEQLRGTAVLRSFSGELILTAEDESPTLANPPSTASGYRTHPAPLPFIPFTARSQPNLPCLTAAVSWRCTDSTNTDGPSVPIVPPYLPLLTVPVYQQ